MKNRSRSWLSIRISVAVLLAGMVVGLVAESPGGATTPPTTSVLIPSNGATLSGSTYVDASGPNATSVEFLLFGGSYGFSAPVVCTATLTRYGWLCDWNTKTVPDDNYVLVSEAFNSAESTFSSGVSVTVNNPVPSTSVVLPANNATLTGLQYLDATTSGGAATQVKFVISGVDHGVPIMNAPIGAATLTYVGWAAFFNTTELSDGAYTIQSVATYPGGVYATSLGISVNINN